VVTADLVRRLDLTPHAEGGWYRETWRSAFLMNTSRGPRPVGTSILYLLGDGAVSRLHRLAWDEVWHWQGGGDLDLVLLQGRGARSERLAADAPQRTVPAGTWFGAAPASAAPVLVGCTMAPGFHPDDCQLGERAELLAAHPAAAALVRLLTPERNAP
jgi:predicted cupin superfamily sugar epimerase